MVHKNYCFPKIALKLLFRKFWVIKQLFTVGYISASRTNSFCQQFSLVGILALHIQVKASTADLHPQPVTLIKKKKIKHAVLKGKSVLISMAVFCLLGVQIRENQQASTDFSAGINLPHFSYQSFMRLDRLWDGSPVLTQITVTSFIY